MSRHTLLTALLAAALPLPGQNPQHAVAIVNDPRSHGQVGDNFLSVNEAIQLHNRTLQLTQLSLAEQQQISFIGGDIAIADIDTTLVSTVTLERDPDPIANLPHGFNLRASPYIATIQIGSTNGFVVDSDFCDFRRLVIRGGAVAIRVAQRDTFYGSAFEHLRFEGQTVGAVQVYLVQNDGETFLNFEDCTFVNIPTAVRIDDLASNRRGQIAMRGCTFDGGNMGFLFELGPGGSSYTCRFERSTFQNQSAAGLVLRRATATADRGLVLDLNDLVSRNVPVGVWVDGHATALTDVLARMTDLAATGTALHLGSSGSNTKIALQDAMVAGGVSLAGKTAFALDNVRLTGGALALDVGPSTALTVTQSALAGVSTTVTGASAATFDGCRFDGGSLAGSAGAPVTIRNSFVGSLALGAHATTTGALPGPQLGSTQVPHEVQLGQTFTLGHDLPPGFLGVWLFGLGNDLPPTVQAGMRVYIDMQTIAVYPGIWRGQGQVPFPMPLIPSLRGFHLVCQMLVAHDVGVPGPLMQMPPGGRVLLR